MVPGIVASIDVEGGGMCGPHGVHGVPNCGNVKIFVFYHRVVAVAVHAPEDLQVLHSKCVTVRWRFQVFQKKWMQVLRLGFPCGGWGGGGSDENQYQPSRGKIVFVS